MTIEMVKELLSKYERGYRVAEEIEESGLISKIYKEIVADLKKLID